MCRKYFTSRFVLVKGCDLFLRFLVAAVRQTELCSADQSFPTSFLVLYVYIRLKHCISN